MSIAKFHAIRSANELCYSNRLTHLLRIILCAPHVQAYLCVSGPRRFKRLQFTVARVKKNE